MQVLQNRMYIFEMQIRIHVAGYYIYIRTISQLSLVIHTAVDTQLATAWPCIYRFSQATQEISTISFNP